MKALRTGLLLVMWLVLAVGQAHAGWVMEQEMSQTGSPVKMKKTLTFGNDAMRSEMAEMQMTVIMNFAKDKLYMISGQTHSYMEMNLSEMSKQMQMLLAQGKGKGLQNVTATESAESKVMNGYKCKKIALTQGGKSAGEIWVTPDIKDPAIRAIYEKFIALLGPQAGGPSQGRMEALKKAIGIGFPIVETYVVDGTTLRMEVKNAKQAPVSAALFEPPAGFSKMTPEMVRQQMGAMGGGQPQPGPRR